MNHHKLGVGRGLRKLRHAEGPLVDGRARHDVGVVLLAAHSKLADGVLEEELAVDFVCAHREAIVVLFGAGVEGVVVAALLARPARVSEHQRTSKQYCVWCASGGACPNGQDACQPVHNFL